MTDKTKDINGIKLPTFWDNHPINVGELRKALEEYPDETEIYMEASNSGNKNDTMWSQRAIGTYSCEGHYSKRKALMIVGTIR